MSESIHAVSPMKIEKLLADNGSRFPVRFAGKRMKPSGHHAFDGESALMGIEHRLIKPRHPQTMGMVERFSGCISDILLTTRLRSRMDSTGTGTTAGQGGRPLSLA